jgi:23S rRNA (pseudouridine1915-N3)-methyltransferase
MLRVVLICVGRAKAGAERDLAARYIERAKLAGRAAGLVVELREIDESRARRPADRKTGEAKAIAAQIEPGGLVVALDETGKPADSLHFASLIGAARDEGAPGFNLVIGGPDGLDPAWRRTAAHVIAFGAMTWPHQLVRIMAGEQIYRAVTILTGHPYHRA